MRTARECLVKAIEMDALADRDAQPMFCAAWRSMADDWRTLARRACRQDDPFLLRRDVFDSANPPSGL